MSEIAPELDYLIVGHGIGGLSVAWHLEKAGKTFHILGDSSAPSSSRVAAGIMNPLTGRKLVKTWLADDLFPYAKAFYSDLETHLDAKFFHPLSVFRPYRSIEEQNTYLAQSAEKTLSNYIGKGEAQDKIATYVNMAFGGLEVTGAGWVDLPLLLDKSKAYFLRKDQYIETRFDFHDLNLSNSVVEWKGVRYGKIILCQGFEAVNNPVFDWLPFTPVKGQVLEIKTEQELEPHVVNQGIFILPHAKNRAKVGATYSWDPLDWAPTQEATAELEEKLKLLLKVPYQITGEIAGIRPSVKDRRPLIGTHPIRQNVCIFNGLGTKGVTLAPFFADQFVQHLINHKELNPLVNIQRYFSLYFH
jgi:glycine/D-amino acid oxidase-like deaminating enzyme